MPSDANGVSDSNAGGDDSNATITLRVLDAVHTNSSVTQRRLAGDLGIALGLTNAYLRRCIGKGWVKVRQAPPNRYLYYLTPKGFAEKSRLTGEYLSASFTFFRNARQQCTEVLGAAAQRHWHRIALYGASELAEVASLCEAPSIQLVGIVDSEANTEEFAHLRVFAELSGAGPIDAVLLTTLKDPQVVYESLLNELPAERILLPPLLRVTPLVTSGD